MTTNYNYSFYDAQNHFCRSCNVCIETAHDYLHHLHSSNHKKVIERPWHEKLVNDQFPEYENAETKIVPVCLQYLIPVSAFYCKLCSFWMGDEHCATLHLQSQTHYYKYLEYLAQNPNRKSLRNEEDTAVTIKYERNDECNWEAGDSSDNKKDVEASTSSVAIAKENSNNVLTNDVHEDIEIMAESEVAIDFYDGDSPHLQQQHFQTDEYTNVCKVETIVNEDPLTESQNLQGKTKSSDSSNNKESLEASTSSVAIAKENNDNDLTKDVHKNGEFEVAIDFYDGESPHLQQQHLQTDESTNTSMRKANEMLCKVETKVNEDSLSESDILQRINDTFIAPESGTVEQYIHTSINAPTACVCGYKTENIYCMRKHREKCNGEPYCVKCKRQTFLKGQKLENHNCAALNSRFDCNICGKFFRTKYSRDAHVANKVCSP